MDRCSRLGLRSFALAALAILLVVGGSGRAAEPSAAATDTWHHIGADGQPVVDLWFGWSSTCPHCARARAWLADFAPTAPWLEVHALQVDGADAQADIEQLVTLATGIGEDIEAVPAFLYAGRLEIGFDDATTTGALMEEALATYRDSLIASGPVASATPPVVPVDGAAGGGTAITLPFIGTIDAATVSLPVMTVVLGGLDAVNPCALSILLFLISALVGARSRRRIVVVGGTFVVATGIVYFLLMAAWLNAFLWFGELRLITALAGIAAIAAGLLNVKDFAWFRRGPSLVIPDSARPAIFGRMLDLSETVALPALLGTTVLVAATSSAYEMLCTGGFPVVFTRVLTLAGLSTPAYYAYLAAYVLVYILPMLAIVAIFAVTLGTRGISIDEARRLKLLSGLLMLGIGSLLLFAPDRLSDLTWTIGLFAAAGTIWLILVAIDRNRAGGNPSIAQLRK